jgi:hypothetical protein
MQAESELPAYCESCGRKTSPGKQFCQYCGRPTSLADQPPASRKIRNNQWTGGFLIVISSIISLISVPILLSFAHHYKELVQAIPLYFLIVYYVDAMDIIAAALAVLGVVALVGGISAVNEGFGVAKHRWLPTIGGIASVFGIAGSVGLAGLILIVLDNRRQDEKFSKDMWPAKWQRPKEEPIDAAGSGSTYEDLSKSPLMRR